MNTRTILSATVLLIGASAAFGQAKDGKGKAPPPPMSFFVTSTGGGKGADLGGLAGADMHCQMLAAAVGRGSSTWHAYLSTQAANGQPAGRCPTRGTVPSMTGRRALGTLSSRGKLRRRSHV